MLTSVTTEDVREPREEGRAALYRYLAGLVASRQPEVNLDLDESQQPDLLSALIRAHDSEGRLNQRELVGMVLLIIIAGFETTRHLIGNGMLALFQHPDQLELLRSRPDLLPSAIEELLRFDAPVPRPTYRVATEDLQIGDVMIPAGGLVTVLLGSANRDPRRFEDPDRLDVTRKDNQHLAFGIGHHYCLGAPLARLEGEIAIGTLVRRLPDIHLIDGAELRWPGTSLFLRGLEALPVAFTPEPRSPSAMPLEPSL
jgi:cytochrome P450